jgi:hypothetical protein
MNKSKILLMISGFVFASVLATTSEAAPPGTKECPPVGTRVHVSGPPGSASREADKNDDGWVCLMPGGNYIDNRRPPA